jgi:hypothetical protein
MSNEELDRLVLEVIRAGEPIKAATIQERVGLEGERGMRVLDRSLQRLRKMGKAIFRAGWRTE